MRVGIVHVWGALRLLVWGGGGAHGPRARGLKFFLKVLVSHVLRALLLLENDYQVPLQPGIPLLHRRLRY